jgi:hypothetical protein
MANGVAALRRNRNSSCCFSRSARSVSVEGCWYHSKYALRAKSWVGIVRIKATITIAITSKTHRSRYHLRFIFSLQPLPWFRIARSTTPLIRLSFPTRSRKFLPVDDVIYALAQDFAPDSEGVALPACFFPARCQCRFALRFLQSLFRGGDQLRGHLVRHRRAKSCRIGPGGANIGFHGRKQIPHFVCISRKWNFYKPSAITSTRKDGLIGLPFARFQPFAILTSGTQHRSSSSFFAVACSMCFFGFVLIHLPVTLSGIS